MIVDRRLVAGAALIAALAVTVVAIVTGAMDDEAVPAPASSSAPTSIEATTTATVGATRPEPSATAPAAAPPVTQPPSVPPSTSTLPADADIDQLVTARRPLPQLMPVDGDTGDGRSDAGDAAALDAASDLAAAATVALWSWRYDDPPDRFTTALAPMVASDVVARLAVSGGELQRRQSAGEVSWAMVTAATASADPAVQGVATVTVTAEQHLTTATTAETVASHVAVWQLRTVDTGWQITAVTVAS